MSTVSQPLATPTGRQNDATPFRGGDFLYLPSAFDDTGIDTGGYCTGGPIVRNSAGDLRMLTAGHCISGVGKFVYRSSRDSATSTGQLDGPYMGNVTQRSYCSNCIDAAVVDSSPPGNTYSAILWAAAIPARRPTPRTVEQRDMRQDRQVPRCVLHADRQYRDAVRRDRAEGLGRSRVTRGVCLAGAPPEPGVAS